MIDEGVDVWNERDERMMSVDYARKSLKRTRMVFLGSAVSTIFSILTVWSFFDWQIALIWALMPITFFGVLINNMAEQVEIKYVYMIYDKHPWLLWTGHFIDHNFMSEEESKALIHDPNRIVRVIPQVHVARTKKDLMIFKLSIGDYL